MRQDGYDPVTGRRRVGRSRQVTHVAHLVAFVALPPLLLLRAITLREQRGWDPATVEATPAANAALAWSTSEFFLHAFLRCSLHEI